MKVTLVDHTENPETKIATFAAICYDSSLDNDKLQRRIKHLMNVNHLATLRFANATFLIEGISRACSHQLVRHPHLSYLQESQRYVNQSNAEFVMPPNVSGTDMVHISSIYEGLTEAYTKLIEAGVKKEDARYILPNGSTTKLYVTGNFQAWHNFLSNRLDSHAQWEIKDVAMWIAEDLIRIAPNVFDKFKRG